MTDSYIRLPTDGSGKKSRTTLDTVGNNDVHTQVIKIADSNNSIISSFGGESQYTVAFDNDSQGQPIYMGEAVVGTSKATAGWRIKKYTYTNGFVTDVQWADAVTTFTKVWNDRASYTYS